jgi:GH24 family phage-related lysozyme (muramidase)
VVKINAGGGGGAVAKASLEKMSVAPEVEEFGGFGINKSVEPVQLASLGKAIIGTIAVKAVTKKPESVSKKGVNLLKSIEQLATTPYDDQTGRDITKWVEGATIGYGHLISNSEWPKYKNGITQDEATALFNDDLKPYVNTVKTKVTADMTQNEFDAMVILTFNIGQRGFTNSSVLKKVNNPSAKTPYKSLEEAWKAWNKSQGVLNKGLINRRQAEWNIYNKGMYQQW